MEYPAACIDLPFALALIIGIILGLFSVSPIRALRIFAGIYVDIIRGIPMMVLAFFIFFGLSDAIGITIPDFAAGVITLTLNAKCVYRRDRSPEGSRLFL